MADSNFPFQPSPTSSQVNRDSNGLFSSPADALREVRNDFHYWSEKLTDSSFELSLAVVAANWAAFGSWQGVVNNLWSKASLVLVLIGVAVNHMGAKFMAELHLKRIAYAEGHAEVWGEEFSKFRNTQNPWPFTSEIERAGLWMRRAKTALPLLGGLAFFLALGCHGN